MIYAGSQSSKRSLTLIIKKDKLRFCYNEEQGKEFLKQKQNVLEMQRIVKDWQEKRDNQETYDAIATIDKVTIPQLSERICPAIEKAGYTEFSLDKPEIGKDVFIGFNCLDSKSGRGDYDSRNALKKTIEKALADTNWRLMSNGISYRLGYLSGRLRAYEREEDLKTLATKNKKLKPNQRSDDAIENKRQLTIQYDAGREVIL